jgi:hypothetical protein
VYRQGTVEELRRILKLLVHRGRSRGSRGEHDQNRPDARDSARPKKIVGKWIVAQQGVEHHTQIFLGCDVVVCQTSSPTQSISRLS